MKILPTFKINGVRSFVNNTNIYSRIAQKIFFLLMHIFLRVLMHICRLCLYKCIKTLLYACMETIHTYLNFFYIVSL